MVKGKLGPFGMLQKAVMYDTELHYYSKLIYAFLVVHQANKNDVVYPSVNFISNKLGIARSTCIKYMNQLEQKGWIEKQLTAGKVNRYLPLHSVEIPVRSADQSEIGLVQEADHTSTPDGPVPVRETDPKNTSIKNTIEDTTFDTNVSKGMHTKFVEVFSSWYLEKFDTQFEWGSDAGKQMKHIKQLKEKILKKIAESESNKTKINDIEFCGQAFRSFLDMINSKFVLENLEPSIINSKFNSIYAAAKNKQFKSTTDLRKWVVPQG